MSPEKTDHVALSSIFSELRLGSSEIEVSNVLREAFVQVGSNSFQKMYPFRDLLPRIDVALVSEWKSLDVQANGWPQIVFAVFDTTNKLTLTDAFWFNNGDIRPVVNGSFNQNLRSVKKGDSIEHIYQMLGKRQCDYFKAADDKWHVRFIYWGYQGRLYVIEADAANGTVLQAGDGTL